MESETGRIYALFNKICLYVGSSYNLDNRLSQHKSSVRNSKRPLYRYIRENDLEFEDIEIRILYSFRTKPTKTRLHKLEAEFIQDLNPLFNVNNPYTGINTSDPVLYRKIYNKKYSSEHRQELNELGRTSYLCNLCQGRFTYANKTAHINSQKHQKGINELIEFVNSNLTLTI